MNFGGGNCFSLCDNALESYVTANQISHLALQCPHNRLYTQENLASLLAMCSLHVFFLGGGSRQGPRLEAWHPTRGPQKSAGPSIADGKQYTPAWRRRCMLTL